MAEGIRRTPPKGVYRSSILLGASILLLFAADARADRKTEEILMVSGAAADLITTEVGLSRGLVEMNPLGQRRFNRIALKAGSTAFSIWVARKLEDNGHPTMAKVVRYVHIGTGFGAAGWNIHATIRWGE